MRHTSECIHIPEIVNLIISFLDHNNQLKCRLINSDFDSLSSPHAFHPSKFYLEYGCFDSFEFKSIWSAEKSSFRPGLPFIKDKLRHELAAYELQKRYSFQLNNLVKFSYLQTPHSPELTNRLLVILRANPTLQEITFRGNPFHGSRRHSVKDLIAVLQLTKGLRQLTFEHPSTFFIADFKLLLDALSGLPLESLKMSVCIQDTNPERELHTLPDFSTETEPNGTLESLDVTFMGREWHHLATIFYRPLLFPLVRRCRSLKNLAISALTKQDSSELTTIFRESCPLIESLRFFASNQDPSEDECSHMILGCRNLKKISGESSPAWNMTVFVPRIVLSQDHCLGLQELYLNTIGHKDSSECLQRLLCSLPNLRVFRQDAGKNAERAAKLNIRDLVKSHWVCHQLEELSIALTSVTWIPGDAVETITQRRQKVRQVYQQLGGLRNIKYLQIRYDVLEESPVQLDITIKTGLKGMGPCLKSLKTFDILYVERCQIGMRDLEYIAERQLSPMDVLYSYNDMHPSSESEKSDSDYQPGDSSEDDE
ncbi:hypothetical protein BG004_001280 [Podila humilis]|nr:hypothetical protein BG004_001280 [Podila humilis]